MVALIPARAGSKRIPGKNTKALAGSPLIAWTIQAAIDSDVFKDVLVSTDDDAVLDIAKKYRADGWKRADRGASDDDSPDIRWLRDIIGRAITNKWLWQPDAFAILRPTSPFRTAATIRRAFERFHTQEVHSMRAVQPVKEHPGKMWTWEGAGYPIKPFVKEIHSSDYVTPWHSMPTQTLQKVYVQNASLEMAWSWVIPAFGTISGNKVAPFFTEGYEGFDLNTMDDWREAERLIKEGLVDLPSLPLARV